MDIMLILMSGIMYACTKTISYCDIYQVLTGIDALSLIANNPVEMEAILTAVINTVNDALLNHSTEVFLSDSDLIELINYALIESGSGQAISAQILRELGLFTNSVIAIILQLGYSIMP